MTTARLSTAQGSALGARYPDTGRVSTYVRRAFGARAAAITGWWFYFAVPCEVPVAVVIGVLYLAVAAASILGLGGSPKVVAAVVAIVLTLGTMNTYVAGGARLCAALGRDGALSGWLAPGSGPGEVPRRSLAVIAGLSLAGLGFLAVTGDGVRPLLLATTSCVVAVYAVVAAGAVRLLDRGSVGRRTAVLAFLLELALLAVTGWYLLLPAVLAVTATCYLRRTGRTGRIHRPRWDGVAPGDPRPTAAILSTARSPHH
jgi:amino acid transporter